MVEGKKSGAILQESRFAKIVTFNTKQIIEIKSGRPYSIIHRGDRVD